MDTFDYTRFYNSIAPVYAFGQALLPVWRGYVESVFPWMPAQGQLLEIGPGPGLLLSQLARREGMVVGLDLSPGMLHECQRRLRKDGLTAGLVNADSAHLPLAPESFDGVVLTFSFSAFPDGAGVMAEIVRVMRPKGVVTLVDACLPSSGNWAGVALARAWERFGDFMRDEADLMRGAGPDIVVSREFGAFDSIRLTVGRKS